MIRISYWVCFSGEPHCSYGSQCPDIRWKQEKKAPGLTDLTFLLGETDNKGNKQVNMEDTK